MVYNIVHLFQKTLPIKLCVLIKINYSFCSKWLNEYTLSLLFKRGLQSEEEVQG